MADLASLRRKRGAIQASITNLTKALDDWEAAEPDIRDPEFLSAYLEGVQNSFSGFSEIQDELEAADATEYNRRAEMESKFYKTVGRAKKLLREHCGSSATTSSRTSTPAHFSTPVSVALPKVELPKFDGAPEGWATFYDIFCSLIDNNESSPAVQKLQYLRLSLTGRAASAIQSLTTTEANYVTALETLKKKFECERRTLRRHWEILCEYPRLAKDTPTALTNLVDTVHQHTRALKNLKAPVETWDIPLISLILSKVSHNTSWQWELTLRDNKMPAYTELLEFLEKRANCSDFASHNATNEENKTNTFRREEGKNRKWKSSQDKSRAQIYATTSSLSCPICNGEHRIYTCDRFRALSVGERYKAVDNASLCHNCLGRGHSGQSCRATTTCRVCHSRHHTYLHKSSGNQQPAVEPSPSTTPTTPPNQTARQT